MNEYEVRVTRQALEQMKEVVHYISNDLRSGTIRCKRYHKDKLLGVMIFLS